MLFSCTYKYKSSIADADTAIVTNV